MGSVGGIIHVVVVVAQADGLDVLKFGLLIALSLKSDVPSPS